LPALHPAGARGRGPGAADLAWIALAVISGKSVGVAAIHGGDVCDGSSAAHVVDIHRSADRGRSVRGTGRAGECVPAYLDQSGAGGLREVCDEFDGAEIRAAARVVGIAVPIRGEDVPFPRETRKRALGAEGSVGRGWAMVE